MENLVAVEQAAQEKWEKEHIFEVNAPSDKSLPKFFVTFPYPYMNGMLHLGHCFSLSKSEFAVRFWRMKGRQALWPFGLHVTGTPIAACAQKLANEIRMFGNPPQFPEEFLEAKAAVGSAEVVPGQHKGKRGKVATKKPQWHIMQGMGLKDSEIAKFADARHWLNFFPPMALADLKKLGCHIDYRRSFITTDVNPYYDSFVQWQFRNLQQRNLLQYGKRYSIFAPVDNQPCADHDRATGEGVQPQEYVVVKLKVQNPKEQPPFVKYSAIIGDKDVILPGATLRAETVVGQTNCWVGPSITYRAYEVVTPQSKPQIFIMTARAARNMVWQDNIVNGVQSTEVEPLFEVAGEEMIGLPISAPHCPFETIYTLPMHTVNESKGTGIVMCVPSDSPDDYINLTSLQKKAEYRKKLGLKDEWVMPFEVVPIIDIPGEFGTDSAKIACEKNKVNGPNDAVALDAAKKEVYQAGFYQGTMIAGPFKGEKVMNAKVLMMQKMLDEDQCIRYYEPTKQVMSRSGDECVVALCNQWYLEYGKEEWKKAVVEHLESMEMYFPGIRNCFQETLNWLAEWPCSRSFGLGTSIPFDSQKNIIDSLSDSTIYMAYYTVARFFHQAADGSLNLEGTKPNAYGITPNMVTDAFWDYVLRGSGTAEEVNAATGFPVEIAHKMREEFEYWYPVDLRVSAKDLIQNHLTMFLYNHAAIWPDDKSKWPRGIYCNGHVQVDGEKMSKSLGNFITLRDAIAMYGADCTRLACADAGDSLDDANFVRETAQNFNKKLIALIANAQEIVEKASTMRSGEFTTFDKIFENAINAAIIRCDQFYSKMSFRMALNSAYYEFTPDYNLYKIECGADGLHQALAVRYIETITLLLAPLAPHTAEYIWGEVLKKQGSVTTASFPTPSAPISFAMRMASRLINDLCSDIRSQAQKLSKKGGAVDEVHVYIAPSYLEWQVKGLEALKKIYDENDSSFPAETKKMIIALKEDWLTNNSKIMQEIMGFIDFVRGNTEKYGPEALAITPAIDDLQLLASVLPFVASFSNVQKVHLHTCDDESIPQHQIARNKARPMEPAISFAPNAAPPAKGKGKK